MFLHRCCILFGVLVVGGILIFRCKRCRSLPVLLVVLLLLLMLLLVLFRVIFSIIAIDCIAASDGSFLSLDNRHTGLRPSSISVHHTPANSL